MGSYVLSVLSVLCCLFMFPVPVKCVVDDHYERLKFFSSVSLLIKTSSSLHSETTDDIRITFIGDLSESGPHSLGSFLSPGELVTRHITFDRVIGRIEGILLSNRGTDGWLLADLSAVMGDTQYEFEWKRQWLDTIDPQLLDLYGNGYEPFCQESLQQLPAHSTLYLRVARTIPIVSVSGVYRPDLATLLS